MKTMKAICTATILALVLTVPAYAGDISTPGVSCEGEIGCPGTPAPGDVATPGSQSTLLGDIGSPGLMDILWTVFTLV